MADSLSQHLTMPLYASPAMRAIMSDQSRLQRMLDFEAALARAEAAVGIVPASRAGVIAEACRAERYDAASLVQDSIPSGNLAIAVVNALTKEVAARDKAASNFVHWGATSQDVMDTALVLELRIAIDAMVLDLDAAIKGFTTLAGRHRRTLAVARTLMQHALPMPFGLRLAGYAAALARSRERLLRLRRDALALQFGGAAGTLAALGEHGIAVSQRLAALLDLVMPDAPWHSHRDRLTEVAACFAILAGTCGKIARDVSLMMQVEVGEASEPGAPGRGGSSTLPHKRNPVGAAAALSAAMAAPNLVATLLAAQVQEYERSLGGTQTEWMTFPALALVTSGALHAVVEIAEGIEIDVDRVRANLERSGGQIMAEAVAFALAEKIGRTEANTMIRELARTADREKRPFKDVVLGDIGIKQHLSSLEVEKLFIPLTYLGSAQTFIDRLVVGSQMRGSRRTEARSAEPAAPAEAAKEPAKPGAPAAEPAADSRLPVAPQLPAAPRLLPVQAPEGGMPAAPVQHAAAADADAPGALMYVLVREAPQSDAEREPGAAAADSDRVKIS